MRRAALLVVLLAAAGCLGIPVHAKTKRRALPERFALPHEWVEVPVDGETVLRGIWVANDGPPVLVLPGSGMGIHRTTEVIEMVHAAGYGVLCCDYRGTGYSSGDWGTSRTLDDDARALWDWLRREKGGPGGVVGVSIGAVAATGLLLHPEPPAAIVLDRPVNPQNVVGHYVETYIGGAIARGIAALLVRPKADVEMAAWLGATAVPTLVVLPEYDVLHPPHRARELLAGRSAAVAVATVPGGHLSSHLVEPERWRGAILDFLDARLRPEGPALGGRTVPRPAARVAAWSFDGRTLRFTLDRDAAGDFAVFVLGGRGNGVVRWRGPRGREFLFRADRAAWRRLGLPLFGVRLAPIDVPRPVGRRWEIGIDPE